MFNLSVTVVVPSPGLPEISAESWDQLWGFPPGYIFLVAYRRQLVEFATAPWQENRSPHPPRSCSQWLIDYVQIGLVWRFGRAVY